MELTETCRSCGTSQGCDCRISLVRFFSLLRKAEDRVSTLKLQSTPPSPPPASALIDKLTYQLPTAIPTSTLHTRLRAAGLGFKLTKLNDHRWYIRVGSEGTGTYFSQQGPRSSPLAFRLITRPSAFENFARYAEHLGMILPPSEIEGAKITRLDLAIDYRECLENVLSGFDFTRKQTRVAYQDKGGSRTGVCIGRGSERIVVYDKAAESGAEELRTRIEIQLAGKKLPARNLDDLRKTFAQRDWDPFDQITLNQVGFPTEVDHFTKIQRERLADLKPILRREGLFSARREFNKQGNFIRDFRSLISVTPWSEQPSDTLRKYFADYFNTP